MKDFQILNFTNLDIWSRDPLSLDGGVQEGGLIDPSCPTRPPAQPQPLESNRNCEAARAGRLLLFARNILLWPPFGETRRQNKVSGLTGSTVLFEGGLSDSPWFILVPTTATSISG